MIQVIVYGVLDREIERGAERKGRREREREGRDGAGELCCDGESVC